MSKRFSIEAVFTAIDKITAPVNRMQNAVGKLRRTLKSDFGKVAKDVNAFSNSFRRAATTTAFAGAAIGGVLFNIIKVGTGFEQAMANLESIAPTIAKGIGGLRALAKELGRTTRFTATEAANAMEIMARAGFTPKQIMEGVPAVLSGAAASTMEIADVAFIVSNALKGMQLETDQSARVVNVLVRAASRTNSTLGTLGESLSNVASAAAGVGITVEETVASLALLQDLGIKPSVTGSAFNTMIANLANPDAKTQRKLKSLDIGFKVLEGPNKGDMLPFIDVLGNMTKATEEVGGNLERAKFFMELVGIRGQKAADNLAGLAKAGRLVALIEELREAGASAGTLNSAVNMMASIRMNTLQGDLLLLNSVIDGVLIESLENTDGALRKVVQGWTRWVELRGDKIAEKIGKALVFLAENMDEVYARLILLAEFLIFYAALSIAVKIATLSFLAFSIVVGATKLILTAFAGVMTVYAKRALLLATALKGARIAVLLLNMAFIANPIGLVVTAIGVLLGLAGLLLLYWEPVSKWFGELFSDVFDFIGKIMDAVAGVFDLFSFGDKALGDIKGAVEVEMAASKAALASDVITPSERIARSIEESRETSTAEVTIKAENIFDVQTTGKLSPLVTIEQTGDL